MCSEQQIQTSIEQLLVMTEKFSSVQTQTLTSLSSSCLLCVLSSLWEWRCRPSFELQRRRLAGQQNVSCEVLFLAALRVSLIGILRETQTWGSQRHHQGFKLTPRLLLFPVYVLFVRSCTCLFISPLMITPLDLNKQIN